MSLLLDNKGKKVVLLTLIGFILSVAFWYAVQSCFDLMGSEDHTGSGIIVRLTAAFILFCANLSWLGLGGVILKKRKYFYPFLLFSQAGFLVFFGTTIFDWGAYVVLFVAGWLWLFSAGRDFQTRKKIVLTRSLHFGLRTALTLILLVVAFSFYWQLSQELSPAHMLAKIETFEVAFMNKIIAFQTKDYSPEMSFESFLRASADNGFLGSFLVSGVSSDQLSPEVLAYLRKTYAQRLNIQIEPGQPVGAVLQEVVHQYLTLLLQKYSRFFPFALAIILFLALRILGIFYFIFIKLFALLFYKVLLQAGLIKIETVKAKVEKVSL